MLEILASGGQYIAIVVLCVTSWLAGRSLRSKDDRPLALLTAAGLQQFAGSLAESTERGPHTEPVAAHRTNSNAEGRPDRNKLANKHMRRNSANSSSETFVAEMPDCERRYAQGPLAIPRRARRVHHLIREGDLSQEGVLESLVALAEEQEALCAGSAPGMPADGDECESAHQARHDIALRKVAAWPRANLNSAPVGRDPLQRYARCAEPRILKRTDGVAEPLPAELVDPLTPQVLARYQLYAEECNSVATPGASHSGIKY